MTRKIHPLPITGQKLYLKIKLWFIIVPSCHVLTWTRENMLSGASFIKALIPFHKALTS
jgi:hypothetical protein